MGLWLGTSGFSYPEWRPSFYPAELPPRAFLRFYATRFNSVEIDSSFYRVPTLQTVEGWRMSTPPGFRFALKASRRITHFDRLRLSTEALDCFLAAARALGDRLGLILYQLPPQFTIDLDRLTRFLAALPEDVRAAFEVRHPSWYVPEVYARLRERNVALCARDDDEGPTPLELTARFTCVRLRAAAYPPERLEEWRRRFRAWDDQGLDVYAYVKHKDNPRAPLVARELLAA